MVSKERVKYLLEEYGELIITTEAGVRYEIHEDVEWIDEDEDLIQWDSGSKLFWLDATAIESVKTHKSHEMGGV